VDSDDIHDPTDRLTLPVEFSLMGHRESALTCPECGSAMIVVSYGLSVGDRPLEASEATSCGACHFVVRGSS